MASASDAARRLPLFARTIECARWWTVSAGVCTVRSRIRLAVAAFSQRLAARFFGPTMVIELLATGASVILRTASSDRLVFWGVFLNREYEFDYGVADPSVIVDAGANIGLTSIFYALRYPKARIVALEPERENFRLLQTNVSGFATVSASRVALWDASGTVEIYDPGEGAWGFRVGDRSSSEVSAAHEVCRATTVEELLDTNGGRIDILKLDIEGSEWNVLLHAGDWIDRVGAVVAELHRSVHPDCEEVFDAATQGLHVHDERHGLVMARH